MKMKGLRKVLDAQPLSWRARKDSNLRPSESKSAQPLNNINARSELSRSVHALTGLENFARSECEIGDDRA
jgi:hypothetical protein